MKKPAVPEDEPARLETLRALSILDTPPEERFDRLTRMARKLFDVPMALVSLVDENRQWFKSCVGLDVKQTARDVSFCGHAILGNDTFVIPDTFEDERFSDNPLVVGAPHIRFYAGCPLRAPDGRKLGTFCILDRQPRLLTGDDLQMLSDLASLVEREFSAFELATMDDLTELSNRRGFMLVAEHALGFCVRENLPATLVFIDLNDFKPINDTFGHAEGDYALTVFAAALKRVCRESDIVARLGGDEFVVLLSNYSKDDAEALITRFRAELETQHDVCPRGYRLCFSYGIVEYAAPRHGGVFGLLQEGDRLMYEKKRSRRLAAAGRNALFPLAPASAVIVPDGSA